MGKISKKLIVYLDQCLLSDMAKLDVPQKQEKIKPIIKSVFERLHQGVGEEKIVVPASWQQDIETSFNTALKEYITRYQGYLGQLKFIHDITIYHAQIYRYAQGYLEGKLEEAEYGEAYREDPDQLIERFGISVDMRLESLDLKKDKETSAINLDAVRKSILQRKATFEDQKELEIDAHAQEFLKRDSYVISALTTDKSKIIEFSKSSYFRQIPRIDIYSTLWAYVFTAHGMRKIKPSDIADIEAVSSYLPYVDVYVTDRFMAQAIKTLELDKKYNVKVFDVTESGLQALDQLLESELELTASVSQAFFSVFVIPDQALVENAWEFFRKLGISIDSARASNGWVDCYAFNDGKMPTYEIEMSPGNELPFYGLQDVDEIKIMPGVSLADIHTICATRSKTNSFMVIDRFCEGFERSFIQEAYEASLEGAAEYSGFKIHYKTS